ncbi:MAG TPA: phytanoyl-CoA dioxygenase family protein [Burkholderiaceae bacterium]|nr:phytanoyl-CoA dioxygenase family protein [Burkholderiaceae bacterium]
MISRSQVDHYHEQGAVIIEGLLDQATRLEMKRVLDGLVEASRKVSSHDDVYDLEPGHTAEAPRVRRIKKPHVIHPVFDAFVRSPKMIQVLQALLGDSVRLHGSKLNLKSPRYGSPVEWHQDWAFYPHTNDDLLAIGVMLEDTTVENGAMYYLPGTHRGPTYDHHDEDGYFCGAMDLADSGLSLAQAVACEGPAGSCSFHHVRVIHGSAQNLSDRPRGLLLYEAAAADAFPLLGVPDYGDFRSRLLAGSETIVPRMRDVPIRMPFPPARNQGSIYENQTTGRRFFERVEVPTVGAVAPVRAAA